MTAVDLSKLSSEQLKELLDAKRKEEQQEALDKRDAYEALRAELVTRVQSKVEAVALDVEALHKFVSTETGAFKKILEEYGQLRRSGQMSYSIQEGNFRIDVKHNKVKGFDERADIAACRLIEFLQEWITKADGGSENPMYQLAMTLLERNKNGDLDYKSISKLYSFEAQFGSEEYSAIMELFRESNVIERTALNYYFFKCDERDVWQKVEPSFNRM